MTAGTQDDEILVAVRSRLASPDPVMDLELVASATVLALPTVPLENFLPELAVTLEIETKPTSPGNIRLHADRLMSRKNWCCWGDGRNPKNRRNELRERVSNVADALRQLAKTEHVGVVALSQLARPRDRDINAEPTMLDLKESGDLEAHAHVVVLVHMPIKDNQPTGEDRLLLGKNRHGPMGTITVTFNRDRLEFLPRYEFARNSEGQYAMGAGSR